MHVLELADRLELSSGQREETQSLMSQHKDRARALGAQLVSAERDLDGLFAQRTPTAVEVDAATRRIGMLQAELRAEHLKTHVAQTAILSAEQTRLYGTLRGYASGTTADTEHPSSGDQTRPKHH